MVSKYKATFLAVLLSLSSLVQAAGTAETNKQQPPNIILFLVDDMGLMDTSVPMLADEQGKPQRQPGKGSRNLIAPGTLSPGVTENRL
jgi:hypothetical protein